MATIGDVTTATACSKSYIKHFDEEEDRDFISRPLSPSVKSCRQKRARNASPAPECLTLLENFPIITLKIISGYGMKSEDLARLEACSSAFRRPANISPDPLLSLPELAALDMCLARASFIGMSEDSRLILREKCGGSWKLVLRFFSLSDDCNRRGKNQVSAGCSHSLALSSSGESIYSFGSGEEGQLGHGNLQNQPSPRLISSLESIQIVQVAAARSRSMLVSDKGHLYRIGKDCYGDHDSSEAALDPILLPEKVENLDGIWVVQVALGSYFTAVLSQDGRVFTFSWGHEERMGHSTDSNCTEPMCLGGPLGDLPVAQIAGGHCYLLALAVEPLPRGRSVWSVGCGLGGKLGHGNRNDQKIAREISHFRTLNFEPMAVAAGAWHAAALSTDGRVATWGWGRHGCLGHGGDQCELLPRVIESLHIDGGPRACQVSAGDYTTFVLGKNGEVWSFGHAESLCLGHPTAEFEFDDENDGEIEETVVHLMAARRRDLSVPRRILALESLDDGDRVVQISASSAGHWDAHMLALTRSGRVFACGSGAKGQLGFDVPEGHFQVLLPQPIPSLKL